MSRSWRLGPLWSPLLHRQRRRHGHRPPWSGQRGSGPSHRHAAGRVRQALLAAAAEAPEALLARHHSSAEGIAEAQASRLRRRFGPNVVAAEAPLSAARHLWLAYRNPFNLLLSALAAVSAATGDAHAAAVILAMVLLSTGLRFAQERRGNRAADALKAMVSSHACVLRPGRGGQERPLAELVPGDVVRLAAGDMVPADGRVLQAKDLFVNQAAMTGESLPVEKRAGTLAPPPQAQALEMANLVFMGSNVVSGTATMLVLATGARSFFGEVAAHAAAAPRAPTAFESGVGQVSRLLLRFMGVMVPLVLLVNGFGKGDWLQALLFALSIAVGLTPEMLPMIVTSTLARGAVALSRRRVIVKRLPAIQDLGAMDVLCTDKTGTLTQDRIALVREVDAVGADCPAVLELAWLNSRFQTGLRNLMDQAVLERVPPAASADTDWRLLDEIPFDFQRRRLSVVVARQPPSADGEALLVCKGAVEEVLAVCSRVRDGDTEQPLSPERRAAAHDSADALSDQGLRVLAVAVKRIAGAPDAARAWHADDERELCLAGFIAFLDPPKDSAAPALQALARHGVKVKVLSGDNEHVTQQVCRQVGLAAQGLLLGPQVQALDDAALAQAVEAHDLFARLAPADKERVVAALRRNGHVVGFLGDGINDAPALHAADVGITVDTAVDIAREVADLILLEKSLTVLDEGVLEGRRTFANLLTYVRMAASSNFGNVLSVLLASVLLPFLPMLPMHLLVQNLLYDLSQSALPLDRVDDELVAAPLHWQQAAVAPFMFAFGPLSSLFDIATFALLWFGFHADGVARQTLFQSGWFVEGLLTQTLVVHLIRSPRLPFVGSRAAPALLASTAAVAAFGLWLPMGPLAPWLRLQPLPAAYFGALALLLAAYLMAVQLAKRWWLQRRPWL
ncbi:MAG: magnesium-translocating P-type ATPase [Rubrivivax sp.]